MSFKTYDHILKFINEVLACGSHRALSAVLHKNLRGKNISDGVVSAMLIKATETGKAKNALHFLIFCKQAHGILLSPEQFALAKQCGIPKNKLYGLLSTESVLKTGVKSPLPDQKCLGGSLEGKNETFQIQSYAAVARAPLIQYYRAQKVLEDAADTKRYIQLITSDNMQQDILQGSVLYAKVNILLPYHGILSTKLRNLYSIGNFFGNLESSHLQNIVGAITSKQKQKLKFLHDKDLVSIQSLGSSFAVALLDINPGMTVLDMCAAPGNKTLSIIEKVGNKTGCVVANDENIRRLGGLCERFSKVPVANLLLTKLHASKFPLEIQLNGYGNSNVKQTQKLRFDRVLVDISCSGDGRVLQDPQVLRTWNSMAGLHNHDKQKAALSRALELTHVGGYVLYCTCSLNPIENEAVVAAILKEKKGSLAISRLDSRIFEANPSLKLRAGLITWDVPQEWNRKDLCYSCHGSEQLLPKVLNTARGRLQACKHALRSENQEVHWIQKSLLECRRLMITDNSHYRTGFFYALFKKTAELIPSNNANPAAIYAGPKRHVQILDRLGVSNEMYKLFRPAFDSEKRNISFLVSHGVAQILGSTSLSPTESLYFCEKKGTPLVACTLSTDHGKSMTHQATQIVSRFVPKSRIIELDTDSFIFLIHNRSISTAFFRNVQQILRNEGVDDQEVRIPFKFPPFEKNDHENERQFIVQVKQTVAAYNISLLGLLKGCDKNWTLDVVGLTEKERSQLLAFFQI